MNDTAIHYTNMAKAFSMLTYKGVYLYDLQKNKPIFVSNNSLCCFDFDCKYIIDNGFEKIEKMVDVAQLDFFKNARSVVEEGINGIPESHRVNMVIQYSVMLKHGNHKWEITHKLYPLPNDDGSIGRYILALVSPFVMDDGSDVSILIRQHGYRMLHHKNTGKWNKFEIPKLKESERVHIALAMRGLSIEKIATIVCRSDETVKKTRSKIFNKLGASNISEVVDIVLDYCMFNAF